MRVLGWGADRASRDLERPTERRAAPERTRSAPGVMSTLKRKTPAKATPAKATPAKATPAKATPAKKAPKPDAGETPGKKRKAPVEEEEVVVEPPIAATKKQKKGAPSAAKPIKGATLGRTTVNAKVILLYGPFITTRREGQQKRGKRRRQIEREQ